MHQTIQRFLQRAADGDLIGVDIVDHQGGQVFDAGGKALYVTDEKQKLEHVHILLFQSVARLRRAVRTVDDPAHSAV